MSDSVQVLDVLDYARLAAVGIFLLYALYCIGYVTSHRTLVFNALWAARVFVITISFLWILSILLGLEILWSPKNGLFQVSSNVQAQLCRAHVLVTFGFAEACFFFAALFLIHFRAAASSAKICGWTLASVLPLAVLVGIVFVISDFTDVDALVFDTYDEAQNTCIVPLVALAALLVYIVVFIVLFLYESRRLSRILHNVTLQWRLRFLLFMYIFLLPFGVSCQAASTILASNRVAYQALNLAYCLISVIICVATVWTLMVQPIRDCRFAQTSLSFDKDKEFSDMVMANQALGEGSVTMAEESNGGAASTSSPRAKKYVVDA